MTQYGGPGRVRNEMRSVPAAAGMADQAQRSRPKGRGLWASLCFLLVLVGVGIILYSTLFRLKRVQVIGVSHKSPQEVVTLAGVAEGDNILLLDEEKIRNLINTDRYLIFQDMKRDYPDGLILQVYERIPQASMQSMGVQYTLDGEGMVLEESQTLQLTDGLVAVTGLNITSSQLGRLIVCQNERQLAAFRKVLSELALQEMTAQISELNLADVDNLYLISVDGYTIRLGDDGDIQAKIGSMRAVIDYLKGTERKKGSIDVSVPIHPTYIPAE